MLPDPVSNPGSLIYESGALPIALRGPAILHVKLKQWWVMLTDSTRKYRCRIAGLYDKKQ